MGANHMQGTVMIEGQVKSASRVMAILECFEDVKRPLRISELVRLVGIPQSSMSTLMKTLHVQGFVDYDAEARTYLPSIRIALLGNWMMEGVGTSHTLLAIMRDLNAATGDTVMLGTLLGVQTQYIHVVNSAQRLRFHLRPGMMRPTFRTAIGLVLASLRPDDDIGRMVRRVNTETDRPEDMVRPGDVMAHIREYREKGVLVTSNLATPGAGVVAAVLNGGSSARPIALGIGAPVPRLVSGREFLVESLAGAVHRYAEGRKDRAA